MKLQPRIQELLKCLSSGMHEREETVAVAFLGALSGQNTFLLGPPGTAKSLISRRIACGFEDPTYFEYLMNRFSTPEEVFGPVSIKELKADNYVRKTAGYLPTAEFVFLDEIWKASPAILNALLTIVNEHLFRNGDSNDKAPLKALISASNETPDANQGLEALYDRFIVRLLVSPITQVEHFNSLINSRPTEAALQVPKDLVVTQAEWAEWREQMFTSVQLSKETLTIIHLIREALQAQRDTLQVYVSDRRWQRAAMLMKAAAFFNDRKATNHSDALLLQHCLWTTNGNREAVAEIVARAVRETGFEVGVNLAEIDREKDALDKEICKELYYSEDLYKTVELDGISYFRVSANFDGGYGPGIQQHDLRIPADRMKTTEEFAPLNALGQPVSTIKGNFDGQGTCELRRVGITGHHVKPYRFKPTVLFRKGDKKSEINERLVAALADTVTELKAKVANCLEQTQASAETYRRKMASVFVPDEKTALAFEGVADRIGQLQLRLTDCERLDSLCQ